MSAPTGLVTFLLTDVEGSTRLWGRDPRAMSRALEIHDTALSAAIDAHHGTVFSRAGDSFAAAFSSPQDAVLAAIEGQQAMAAAKFGDIGPLRVRMALHAGVAEERDGDYYGPSVNRCARLLDVTNGGQIVGSGEVASMLVATPVPGVTLRDLGEHRLRDLPGTEQVFDVSHPDLAGGARPDRSSGGHHNLPPSLTRFLGRSAEVAEVADLIRSNPLITLTGVGGVGKSRLAHQALAEMVAEFPGGVWWVDLSATADPASVPSVVAEAVGVLERPPEPLAETVVEHLGIRPTVLLLDNCDHVLDGAVKLVDLAMRYRAELRLVVTSREALAIAGEAVHVVQPLGTESGSGGRLSSAAELLLDRARLVDPGFAGEHGELEHLCRQLDGIPLAIELAAAWVPTLALGEISARLEDRFSLLRGQDRLAAPHHQTLLSTMDWSYEQLTPPERILFQRLSVFRGGFTLDAVAAVCGYGDVDPDDVVHLLNGLVRKSLVARVATDRYTLLETVRLYGAKRRADVDAGDLLERRHAEFLLQAGPRGADGVPEPDVRFDWFSFRDIEHDNYRAALEWSLATGHLDLATGLAIEMGNYWLNAGCCLQEGDRWLQALLARLDRSPSHGLQRVFTFAAFQALMLGRYDQAEHFASEIAAIAEGLGDHAGTASALTIRASIAHEVGRLDDAVEFARAAFEIVDLLHDPRSSDKLLHLVMVLIAQGDYAGAEQRLDQHARLMRSRPDAEGVPLQEMWLGVLDYHRGELARAGRHLHDAVQAMPPIMRSGVAYGRMYQAKLALAQGRCDRAAAVSRVVRSLGVQLGDPAIEVEAAVIEAEAAVMSGDLELGSGALIAAHERVARGQAHRTAGAVAAARAALEVGRDPESAVTWLASSEVLRLARGSVRAVPEQQRFDASCAAVRRALGGDAFERRWSAVMSIDRAAALDMVTDPSTCA